MKRLTIFLIGLVFIASFADVSTTYAASEFSSAYDVAYEVKSSGLTMVTQNIYLTNLTTNYYASDFSLTFATEKIDEISAWDGQGPLKLSLAKENGQTQIKVSFNQRVVGIGKTLNWTLRFSSPEVAKKNGRIWEINIPRVAPQEETASYNVSLFFPPELGLPAYVSPRPKTAYFWTKAEGSDKGISLAFGDWQGFAFDLTYHLENPYLTPGQTQIAIPPDTVSQKIILEKISPTPVDLTVDEDGNWLANYHLLPKQKQEVRVTGFAQVFITPREDFPTEEKEKIYQKYLKPEKFWQTEDPEIKRLGQTLKTPEAIYQYVVSTLNYDYQRAEGSAKRLGAKEALVTPSKAICMEFTDLFISLARAAGIPAREVAGFAYTTNSRLRPLSLVTDVLHAWPEYFNEQKGVWVQVDPTWGKTSLIDYFSKFDFNHLAFVKWGITSSGPPPAGSYKGGTAGKDVLVNFVSDVAVSTPSQPEVEFVFPKNVISSLPVNGQIRLKNKNKVALYNLSLTLSSSLLAPTLKDFYLTVLPPLSERSVSVELKNPNPFLAGKNVLTLDLKQQTVSTVFNVIPFVLPVLTILLSIILAHYALGRLWTRFLKKT